MIQSDAEPKQDVRKLISELRELGELYATDEISDAYPGVGELMLQAAAALAQSDAELVAWRFRWGDEPWKYTDDEESALRINKGFNYTVEPLYRSGAKSDASAGLIEAAKEIERRACRESHFHRAEALNEAARFIRAAADRSQP